jgi:Kef-type K+ transport system membrane component KefB
MSSLLTLVLIIGIILFIPLFCRKIHVPSIVGFILAGMAIGPSVLGWVGNSHTINMLGKLGMLYIMFQSGSEIDMNDFRQLRYHAIIFGILSFFIPLGLGLVTSHWVLGMNWSTSLLLASMYGSHTLMTYPIISRYGIQKNRAVNITVGATMWAITLSLMVLAVIEGYIRGTATSIDYLIQAGMLVLFLVTVLWLFPWLTRLFFKRYRDPISGYAVVMLMLVSAALLAELAGLDGILGAFVCGVSLNRLLPNRSPLVGRLTFVGNSIFVPLFLISVGLMIDVEMFWSGWGTIMIAIVMIATKLVSKSLSSWLGQWLFRFSNMERTLIFGLTHASAAGTLAIATIGYEMGIFSSEMLNASVLMILVLCTTASFITEYAAKQIALHENAQLVSDHEDDYWLLTSVGTDLRATLRELSTMASLNNVEINESNDWSDVVVTVEHVSKSVMVYHEHQPINTISRILVAVPRYAEKERDFITCFGMIRRLAGELGAKVVFYANPDTQVVLRAMCRRPGKMLPATFRDMNDWEDIPLISKDLKTNDMPIFISSRKSTASYNPLFEQIPQTLANYFSNNSYMVLYPEQQTGGPDMDVLLMDIPPASTTWSFLARCKRLAKRLLKLDKE